MMQKWLGYLSFALICYSRSVLSQACTTNDQCSSYKCCRRTGGCTGYDSPCHCKDNADCDTQEVCLSGYCYEHNQPTTDPYTFAFTFSSICSFDSDCSGSQRCDDGKCKSGEWWFASTGGTIVGIVLFLIAVVIVIFLYCLCKKKKHLPVLARPNERQPTTDVYIGRNRQRIPYQITPGPQEGTATTIQVVDDHPLPIAAPPPYNSLEVQAHNSVSEDYPPSYEEAVQNLRIPPA